MAEHEAEIFSSAETAAKESDELPEGQSYPLSSKRLTSSHICQLATELRLPTNACTNEMRQMIEGTLTIQGRAGKYAAHSSGEEDSDRSASLPR